MSRFLIAVLASLCLVGGCATARSATVSPYFHPAGTSLLYQYGNFCGPGVPVHEGQPTADNLRIVESLAPVDDIDFGCKVHDLCSLRYGVGGWCDGALEAYFDGNGGFDADGDRVAFLDHGHEFLADQCRNLSNEISGAVVLRMSSREPDIVPAMVLGPLLATVELGASAISRISAHGPHWPVPPGQCYMANSRLAVARLAHELAQARAWSEPGNHAVIYARIQAYEQTFNMDAWLAGGW